MYPKCYCACCGEETGYTPGDESENYFSEVGYICEVCLQDLECTLCYGRGEIEILLDEDGNVDYLEGFPSGLYTTCENCGGVGFDFSCVEC